MRGALLVVLATAPGCADLPPEHVPLRTEAQDVDIATAPPSPDAYTLVGEVVGQAAAPDIDEAQDAARNDLRNRAAALGASLVTIDQDTGEPILLFGKTKVTLVGRAYKPVD